MRSTLLAVLVILAACGEATRPSTDLRYASWLMGCSMVGTETWITLSSNNADSAAPVHPFVSIRIAKPLGEVQGSWVTGSPSVRAFYAMSPSLYQPAAPLGNVTILGVNADSVIHGSFSLQFPSRSIVGEFWAGWSHQVMACA